MPRSLLRGNSLRSVQNDEVADGFVGRWWAYSDVHAAQTLPSHVILSERLLRVTKNLGCANGR